MNNSEYLHANSSIALNPDQMTSLLAFSDERLQIKLFASAQYNATHEAMASRILQRIEDKKAGVEHPDELWIVEHQDVYTLGQAGKKEHILRETDTPIVQTDRGGQVTWHGTGQLVVYWLFDLHRLGFGVRDLVSHAEQAIEDVLAQFLPQTLIAKARRDAPGVYIYNHDGDMLGKIASLGFKIKQGFSYHGVAINLSCDMSAFGAINPCGYAGMPMAKLTSFGQFLPSDSERFTAEFIKNIRARAAHQVALRALDTLK